jgi:A/G-specific adenine glycosylase
MNNNINQRALLIPLFIWYEANKREMPWRNTHNPYKIWLSEVILQQTRVDQGLPYYLNFVKKYPTIKHLADADINEVLRLWQGLGYYSRARNLHKCAKTVNNEMAGFFPKERRELEKLPGIGPYTAAAIASFAFKKKEAVVDGNVMRVITRLYGIKEDISEQKTVKKISSIVNDLIPSDTPDIFNHAMMEFGSTYCIPKNPNCEACIFKNICIANLQGLQSQLPTKNKKIKKKTRWFNYLIIHWKDRILLRKRISNDIWQGLFEFYLVESVAKQDFHELSLPDQLVDSSEQWKLTNESKLLKHVLTHQNIMCKFYHIHFDDSYLYKAEIWDHYKLYSIEEIEDLPKPILIDKYLGEKII